MCHGLIKLYNDKAFEPLQVARIEAIFNKTFCGSPLFPLLKIYIYIL